MMKTLPMNNRFWKLFWVFTVILSPALPLQLYFGGSWYSIFHSYSLGMFFGIVSYVYFFFTLIAASRIRFFDRLYGHDKVLVFHGYMALAALVFSVLHYIFKTMFFKENTVQIVIGATGLILFLLISVLTIFFMVNMPVHRIKIIRKFKNYFVYHFGFDYSLLKLFHNFTALAFLLITVHILGASATLEVTSRIIAVGTCSSLALFTFINHKFLRPVLHYRKSLKVTSVNRLADNIIEIRMNLPQGRAPHKAGQYGYFRFLSPLCGRWEHPFTVSSAPQSKELAITVKKLGNYTEKLPEIKAGTRVIFDGPYGKFTPVQNGNPLLFIAGGIGITPFLSILSHWEKDRIMVPLTLIWSSRYFNEMIHFKFFKRIEEQNDNFRFIPIVTGEMIQGCKGRIDSAFLKDNINVKKADIISAFICGPEPLLHSASKNLKEIGIRNIYFEKFSY